MARRRRAAQVRPDQSFKGRKFTAEVILWAVCWYLMFPISYRDLELMLRDHGGMVDHTMVFRWIQTVLSDCSCSTDADERYGYSNMQGFQGGTRP